LLAHWRAFSLAGYAAALLSFVAAHLDREPYDDSYFFKRIALNALDRGTLAWNADEGPVYGSTSQTMQVLAVAVAAVTRDHYMLLTRGLAVLTLVGTLAVLLRLTRGLDDGLSCLFAFSTPALLFPALSGMETALSLLQISALLACLYSASGRAQNWWMAPLLLLLIYPSRPDASLLGLPLLLGERAVQERRWPWRELVLLAAGFGAWLALFRACYGTALPLPFYAKHAAFSPYDSHFIRVSQKVGWQRFAVFALGAAPLACAALLRRDRTNLLLLGSAGAFVLYHLAFTIDVMGMHGRFYAPAMPLLALASARAAQRERQAPWALACLLIVSCGVLVALHWLPVRTGSALENVPLVLVAICAVGGAALLIALNRGESRRWLAAGLLLSLLVASGSRVRAARLHVFSDEQYLAMHTSRFTVYRGLDTLRACFGEQLHVYHSEVGVPGLRFQAGKVTDVAGLLSPAWLFGRTDVESACRADRPAAIFLPHRNYVELNRRFVQSSCLRGYRRVVDDSSSPLYVRRDLASRFLACASERADPFVSASLEGGRRRPHSPK